MKRIVLLLLLICEISYGQGATSLNPVTSLNPNNINAPLKVGDEFPVTLPTGHPYNPTGIEGVVYEQEFYNKNSSYIKLYFKNFNLAPGDYVEISTVNTGESIIYAGQGKIIDQNQTMISDFWSQALFDERVIVRLHALSGTNYYGFDITRVAYGYPQAQIDAILNAKAICGQDDKEPIICYNGTTMYDKGRAVCRLLINGSGFCTGWLLGCDGHLMTNNHCIGTASDAANTDFLFNYQYTNCNGSGNSVSDLVATAATFIKTSSALDYTLVELPVNPTTTYGYLSLSSVAPVVNDRIYIVGHPGGRRKEITVVTDLGADANGNAIINQITGTGARYMADTEGGSSGSPVLDFNTNLVIAIHNTGGCTNGSSGRSDQLIAHIGADMPNCGIDSSGGAIPIPCGTTINSFPYVESFENTIGDWAQSANDDFDWTVLSGPTQSTGTGPAGANDGNYYAYMEASNPNNPTKNAKLLSPCFDLSGIAYPELVFNYHMLGANMGTLLVEVSTNNATWTTLWTKTGDQGGNWVSDTIDLNAYTNETSLRVRFNGTIGSNYESDIAIDAFSIAAGIPNCVLINTFPYTESFENTLGNWTQDTGDDFDWTVLSGATQSTGTGPNSANHGTYYAYMEASNPNNPAKNARLLSPCFDLSGLNFPELTFDYHMNGANMGTLDVEVSVGGGSWTSLWTRTGDQGSAWLSTTIDLSVYSNATDLRIRFNGTIGSNYESDIAIDAVSVGAVGFSCPTTISNFPYTEGFENTIGDWIQASDDELDWTVLSGATQSTGTGPTTANEGTYYAYIEASTPNFPAKNGILVSPCFDLTNITDPELTFDYHMYGATMGRLELEARTGTSNWTTLWIRVDDQGDSWRTATINLGSYTNVTDLKLRFNGTTGSNYESDMAIDAFSIVSTTVTTDIVNAQEEETFLTVAPNPFKEYVEIATNIKGISTYRITNIQGQVVQVGELSNKVIQLQNLVQGVYFISFNNGQEHITRKIIKQ